MKLSDTSFSATETNALSHSALQPQCRVLFRTPQATEYVCLVSDVAPLQYDTFADVPISGGYVIAPFRSTPEHPILFIDPDVLERCPLPAEAELNDICGIYDEKEERTAYARAYAAVSRQLRDGAVDKVVLSRTLRVNLSASLTQRHAEQLFFNACLARPNSFVVLCTTPQSGTWLAASPEVLLESVGKQWRTMALAGTMSAGDGNADEWSDKNREEQAIVADFIYRTLSQTVASVERSEPHTLLSGNIKHICTDFHFCLPHIGAARTLVSHLHPTPAVCGMSREQSMRAIMEAEGDTRKYYAGFSGPFNLSGETHLYVSLRCMELFATHAVLHAGGGIMPESIEQDEWLETQRKMQTMLQLINPSK